MSTIPTSAARITTHWSRLTANRCGDLLDGGADILLVETIFDTLNAKAAFFAIQSLFDEGARRVPIMASVTFIQPGSNRGVTGQTRGGVLEFDFARARSSAWE